jgi:hypothetical protein
MKKCSVSYPTEADFVGLYKWVPAGGGPRVGSERSLSRRRGFHPVTGMRFALCFHRRALARTK